MRTNPAALLRPRPGAPARSLSPAGALAALAAEGQGELPSGYGAAELGGGEEAARRVTRETRLLSLILPPREQVGPAASLSFSLGGGGETLLRGGRPPSRGQSREPPACRRRRGRGGGARAEGVGARAAGAPAVAERRQQVAPFPAAAARPLGRGAAGGGVGARVCASVCALWRRLRPPPARSRSLAAGRPFACPRSLPLLHFASLNL